MTLELMLATVRNRVRGLADGISDIIRKWWAAEKAVAQVLKNLA